MIDFNRKWPDFKKLLDGTEKSLRFQYETREDYYALVAVDLSITYDCQVYLADREPTTWTAEQIADNAAWRTDLVTNWLPTANALVGPRLREDGIPYAVPKPSSYSLVMCDRDFRVNTCIVDSAASVQDLKMNTQTNKEEPWNELSLVGVYKNVAGTMTLCDDQADADVNGVLSVWDYHAKVAGQPITYEMRDGMLYVDPTLPAGQEFDHRAYAIVAPAIPGAYGGSIAVFDSYLGANPDNLVAALSPQATVLNPGGPAGAAASTLRLYVVHPAGSKLTHVLRLVTYRAPGTF